MTFSGGGFEIQADGVVFLHGLKGDGAPSELRRFLRSVTEATKGQTLVCTADEPRLTKFYKQSGFVESDGLIEGKTVLVRTPL